MTEQSKSPDVEAQVNEEGVVSARIACEDGEVVVLAPAAFIAQYAARAFLSHVRRLTSGRSTVAECSGLEAVLERGPNSRRSSSIGSVSKPSVLVAAVMELTGKSREEVEASLAALTPAQKRKMIHDDRLSPIYKKHQAERSTKPAKENKADELDALLG